MPLPRNRPLSMCLMPAATAEIFIIRVDVLVPMPMAVVGAMVGETGGAMVEAGVGVGTSTMGVLMGHGAEVAAKMGMDQFTSIVATSQHTLGLLLLWLL